MSTTAQHETSGSASTATTCWSRTAADGADPARWSLTADLTGGLELPLVVTDSGDGIDYDPADWARPQLTYAGGGSR